MFNRLILTFLIFMAQACAMDPQRLQRIDQAIGSVSRKQANDLAAVTQDQQMQGLIRGISDLYLRSNAVSPLMSPLKSLTTLILWKFAINQIDYYRRLSEQSINLNKTLIDRLQLQQRARMAGPAQAEAVNGITQPALSGFWGSCGQGLVSIGNACARLGAGWVKSTQETNMGLKVKLVQVLQEKFGIGQSRANNLATSAEQQIDPSIRYIYSLAQEVLRENGVTADNFMDRMKAADARRTEQAMKTDDSRDDSHPLFPPVTPLDTPQAIVPEEAKPSSAEERQSDDSDVWDDRLYTLGDQFAQGHRK